MQPYPSALDESVIASLAAAQQELPTAGTTAELSRVEYFAVPTQAGAAAAAATQLPVYPPYQHYKEQVYQAGFQAGYNLLQQQLGGEYLPVVCVCVFV